VNPEHDFTEIELALLQQAVQVILAELAQHWRSVKELKPVPLGYENNGRFLQTAPHDTVMLVAAFEVKIGDCVEPIQIGFPYYTLEPLIRALGQPGVSTTANPAKPAAKPAWNPLYDSVRVPVSAAWLDLELTARDLAGLRVGHVLELSPSSADQVSVRLSNIPRFRGRLGTQGSKWAVQLTEVFAK
jgi:flagellar motor switch protein FliM